MIETDILIIGGGAAGLMAACKIAGSGCSVLLVEKGPVPGRKILITGKGRCNITNMCQWEDFKTHIHPDSVFFKSAFFSFSNEDVKSFFERGGVKVKEERGHRLFPESDSAVTVRDFLWKKAVSTGARVMTSADVTNICKMNRLFVSDVILSRKGMMSVEQIVSKTVIITTGGRSYPYTGSTGAGYEFARNFRHTIVDTFPSLTALMPERYDARLRGVHLKNVALSLYIDTDCVETREGELDFTDNGIEGSLGFQLSRRAVSAMKRGQRVSLSIDLKPALAPQLLVERVSRESFGKDLGMKKYLRGYLPSDLIVPFIDANRELSPNNLPVKLKKWEFRISGYTGYERCVVTAGGVSTDEISRKNMESKLVPGLFFAGEVMNLDGDTGGYNLQIAFSTGALAASGAVSYLGKGSLEDENPCQ